MQCVHPRCTAVRHFRVPPGARGHQPQTLALRADPCIVLERLGHPFSCHCAAKWWCMPPLEANGSKAASTCSFRGQALAATGPCHSPGGHQPSSGSFVLSDSCSLVLAGIVRLRDGLRDRYPVEDYLDLFDLAAHQIHQGLQAGSAKAHSKTSRITIGRVSAEPRPLPGQAQLRPASPCRTPGGRASPCRTPCGRASLPGRSPT